MDSRFLKRTELRDVKTFTVIYDNRNDAGGNAYVDGGKTPSNPTHLLEGLEAASGFNFSFGVFSRKE